EACGRPEETPSHARRNADGTCRCSAIQSIACRKDGSWRSKRFSRFAGEIAIGVGHLKSRAGSDDRATLTSLNVSRERRSDGAVTPANAGATVDTSNDKSLLR